jgi:hypothetical protein
MRALPFALVAFASLSVASRAFAFDLHADLAPSVATSLAKGKADCTVAEGGAGLQRRVTCTITHTSLSGAPTSAALFRSAFPLSALASVTCDVSASPIVCTGDVPAASNTYSYLLNEQMSVGISTAAVPAVAGEISGRLLRVVDGGAADGGANDSGANDGGLDAGPPMPADGGVDPADATAPRIDASAPPSKDDASAPTPEGDASTDPGDVGAADGSCSARPGATSGAPWAGIGLALSAVLSARLRRRSRRA